MKPIIPASKKKSTASKNIVESMREASREWGFSLPLLRAAKSHKSCQAFKSRRVNRAILSRWLAKHPEVVAAVEAATNMADIMEDLRCRKLAAQIAALDLKFQCDKGLMFLKTEAQEKYDRCIAVVCEEGRLLMEKPIYAAFIARMKYRMGLLVALGTQQHGPLPAPSSSPL